jgi:aspartokinase
VKDKMIKSLSKLSQVTTEEDKSLISLVGDNLRYVPGTAKRIFNALEKFNVYLISQGASDLSISLIVEKKVLFEALQVLHDEFFNE